jgi:hypothetical protein
MRYCGDKLLPVELRSGNDVKDAATVLAMSHPLYTGKTLRLSSCWMVITATGVTTCFKAHPSTGFDTSGKVKYKDAVDAALKQGDCMLLELNKRSMTPAYLFITYDPRAKRLCKPGKVETSDATSEKTWTP